MQKERIKSLVNEMRKKQIENERTHSTFNRYKPYIIGGGVFIFGIVFMKFYRSFF